MKMPFGKHRGRQLCELPFEYVAWLVDQDFLREPLRSRIQEEFDRRQHTEESEVSVNVKLIDEIMEAGRRALAKRFHPDAGGRHESMMEVNNACDWIKQQARSIA